ncbi:MAG TPA: TIGR00725 family protein [Actinocrinis sp.]|uniref:TIGR00725 family protein n=1 Tax=Actinocrinis sp. TaxID=1920516 RepID=UPI002DDD0DB9|nr:TIGR00725 family protein [Actinocrinis sp.]HEV2344611.1 TIGR00725 family protein [Actinocrinis sp.]
MSRVQVAVCGPSAADAPTLAAAEEVGRLLAERGAVVVCGGYGGVMQAAARGAHAAGGTVVGILSGDDPGPANPHLDIVVPTGLGQARNTVIALSCEALIAVGGSWGTLSEVAHAVRHRERAGRPARVVWLDGWTIPQAPDAILAADTPAGAVDAALSGL